MKNRNRTKGGFTLIETIIYVALFAFIMTSALVSVYSILSSSARNQTKAMVQEEGSFLLGKIDWALSGISSASVSNGGNTLSVIKFDTSIASPVVITLQNESFFIKRGGGPSRQLNNTNVTVSCASDCFERVAGSGDGINPESVEANFTVSAKTSDGLSFSQDFSTIKYLRK